MIVLNLKLDGIYGFDKFEIDFTYPKKIVNSIIENGDNMRNYQVEKLFLVPGIR